MDRLTLALGFACRPVRQQVLNGERLRVSDVSVQCMHHRWSFLDDPYPCVTMAMDPTLVPLRQAEPALQIQIILELIQVVTACKEAGAEAVHQTGHMLMDRLAVATKAIEDHIEVRLTLGRFLPRRVQGRGHLPDRRDVASDRFLLRFHQDQSLVDAGGQPAQLLLREPPFFASKFRWSDCRTSSKASAIRTPGGWRGPPWSSLRIPRTAAQ